MAFMRSGETAPAAACPVGAGRLLTSSTRTPVAETCALIEPYQFGEDDGARAVSARPGGGGVQGGGRIHRVDSSWPLHRRSRPSVQVPQPGSWNSQLQCRILGADRHRRRGWDDAVYCVPVLRGSSFGFTYVISKGPMPYTWMMVSPLAFAQCGIRRGSLAYPPMPNALPDDSSSVLPIP